MKKHIVTFLLFLLIVITEIIYITGYKNNKNFTNTSISTNTNYNSNIVKLALSDTFFYYNNKAKLVYYIPKSFNYNQTKSELKYIQINLSKFKTKHYVWIVSNNDSYNSNLQNLASQCQFNFLHLPNFEIKIDKIKSEPTLFILTSDFNIINPLPVSKTNFMDIELYIKTFLQVNKI